MPADKIVRPARVPIPKWRRAIFTVGGLLIVLVTGTFLIVGSGESPVAATAVLFASGLLLLFLGVFRTHESLVLEKPTAQPNSNSDSGFAIVVLIALFAYWYLPVSNYFRDRIAVYRLDCDSFSQTDAEKCNGAWHVGPATTFVVSTEHQFVVALTDGLAAPERLSKCVVADRTNWSCKGTGDSPTLTMHDGELEYDDSGVTRPDIKFVARLKWWWLKLQPSKNQHPSSE